MANSKEDRLEDALLKFIERELVKNSPEPEIVQAIPAMARELLRLWGFR